MTLVQNWELTLELRGGEDDEWEEEEPSPYVKQLTTSNHLLTWFRQHDLSSPSSPVRPLSPTETLRESSVDARELPPYARETTEATEALEQYNYTKIDPSLPLASHTPSFAPAAISGSAPRVQVTDDPLGPLPNADDYESLRFSCRPCGPRLFDLVARFPASDYGLTSWSLLERDEELFEIDDVRDEEKAMQALWNRWIFFERRYSGCFSYRHHHPLIKLTSRFFLSPKKTVIEFVSKFSAVIKKTAGWKGMRVWLLASPSIFIIKCYS